MSDRSESPELAPAPLYGKEQPATVEEFTIDSEISSIEESTKDESEEEPGEYTVERIVDWEWIDLEETKRQYLVRWEGYNTDEETWEPEESVVHLDVFREYKKSLSDKPRLLTSLHGISSRKRQRPSTDREEPHKKQVAKRSNTQMRLMKSINMHKKRKNVNARTAPINIPTIMPPRFNQRQEALQEEISSDDDSHGRRRSEEAKKAPKKKKTNNAQLIHVESESEMDIRTIANNPVYKTNSKQYDDTSGSEPEPLFIQEMLRLQSIATATDKAPDKESNTNHKKRNNHENPDAELVVFSSSESVSKIPALSPALATTTEQRRRSKVDKGPFSNPPDTKSSITIGLESALLREPEIIRSTKSTPKIKLKLKLKSKSASYPREEVDETDEDQETKKPGQLTAPEKESSELTVEKQLGITPLMEEFMIEFSKSQSKSNINALNFLVTSLIRSSFYQTNYGMFARHSLPSAASTLLNMSHALASRLRNKCCVVVGQADGIESCLLQIILLHVGGKKPENDEEVDVVFIYRQTDDFRRLAPKFLKFTHPRYFTRHGSPVEFWTYEAIGKTSFKPVWAVGCSVFLLLKSFEELTRHSQILEEVVRLLSKSDTSKIILHPFSVGKRTDKSTISLLRTHVSNKTFYISRQNPSSGKFFAKKSKAIHEFDSACLASKVSEAEELKAIVSQLHQIRSFFPGDSRRFGVVLPRDYHVEKRRLEEDGFVGYTWTTLLEEIRAYLF